MITHQATYVLGNMDSLERRIDFTKTIVKADMPTRLGSRIPFHSGWPYNTQIQTVGRQTTTCARANDRSSWSNTSLQGLQI